MDSETVLSTILSVVMPIILLVSLIITAIYSNKRGQTKRLDNEKSFLTTLNTSTSCTCNSAAVVTK